MRIARETAEANAALRRFTPNASLSKSLQSVAESYQPMPTVSRNASLPTDNTRSQRTFRQRNFDARQRPSSAGRRNDRIPQRQAPPAEQVEAYIPPQAAEQFAQHEAAGQAEVYVPPVAEQTSETELPIEAQDAHQETIMTSPTDPPKLAEITQPLIITPDSELADAAGSKNRRDRLSTELLKRTQKRVRDGLIDEGEIPKALKAGLGQIVYKPKSKPALEKSHLSSIEKRRQERLLREKEAENADMSHGSRWDGYSTKRRQTSTRKSSGPNTRAIQRDQSEEDDNYMGENVLAAEGEEDGAYFTSPEPVSLTLTEIFKGTPAFRSAGLKSAGLNRENYSLYVPASTAALFSVPAGELSAVDMATAALSHRADISIPRRQNAIDLVAAATRSRSTTVQASA